MTTRERMDNGWTQSANAWIADMGEHGDFGRRYVLDPVMLPRASRRRPRVRSMSAAAKDASAGGSRREASP